MDTDRLLQRTIAGIKKMQLLPLARTIPLPAQRGAAFQLPTDTKPARAKAVINGIKAEGSELQASYMAPGAPVPNHPRQWEWERAPQRPEEKRSDCLFRTKDGYFLGKLVFFKTKYMYFLLGTGSPDKISMG